VQKTWSKIVVCIIMRQFRGGKFGVTRVRALVERGPAEKTDGHSGKAASRGREQGARIAEAHEGGACGTRVSGRRGKGERVASGTDSLRQ
jgi:hypothetical protein